MTMIKAVIFDLNGIFFTSEKLSERFERDFKVSTEKFLPALKSVLDVVYRPGAGSVFNKLESKLVEWGVDMSEQELLDYWFKSEKPNENMFEFTNNLKKKGVMTFILSNNFKERSKYYQQFSYMSTAFTKVYYSWQTGYLKPSAEAFRSILSEHDLLAEECLYFDDQQQNVSATNAVGIKGYLYTGPEEAKRIIQEHS